MLICRSAAKVNLTLDVLSRRADGYHELSSIVHTIGLWDTLRCEPTESGTFELRCNRPELETTENLVLKAACRWLDAARGNGLPMWSGTRITLEKQIPSGAGLGGGSGNAAATLLALTKLYGATLDRETLHKTAASLGADVPLFLHGGCVLMEGIGERLSPLPPIEGWLLVVQPERLLSTPQVYAEWDALGSPSGNTTPHLLHALQNSTQRSVAVEELANLLHTTMLGNDLSAAAQRCGVDVEFITRQLRQCGALAAGMTGSGSAVFGLFAQEAKAIAAQAHMQHPVQLAHEKMSSGNPARDEADINYWHFMAVAPFCRYGVELMVA
ncbi:MAG TPA: 4-(cytidine 5'-diphospho)-2-C-methyl-D-erythritol kinase [Abditibacteriaceae bacterium]|jgi:4-diphosphocytidyl-2-C-methyl-D-erythritol kinase